MSNDWRSRLTADEEEQLDMLETAQKLAREDLRFLAAKKKAIVNRAIQRKYHPNHKIGVDRPSVWD